MGLFDAKNITKAKSLLNKNRHKIASTVGKATDQLDKATKGKTSKVSSKIDTAARKFASTGIKVDEPTEEEPSDDSADAETVSDSAQA